MSIFEYPQSGRRMLARAVCVLLVLLLLTCSLAPLALFALVSPLDSDGATFATLRWASTTLDWYDQALNEDGKSDYVLVTSRYIERLSISEYDHDAPQPDLQKLFASLSPVMRVKTRLKNVPDSEALCDAKMMAQLAFCLGETKLGQKYYDRYEHIQQRNDHGDDSCATGQLAKPPDAPVGAQERPQAPN